MRRLPSKSLILHEWGDTKLLTELAQCAEKSRMNGNPLGLALQTYGMAVLAGHAHGVETR